MVSPRDRKERQYIHANHQKILMRNKKNHCIFIRISCRYGVKAFNTERTYFVCLAILIQ